MAPDRPTRRPSSFDITVYHPPIGRPDTSSPFFNWSNRKPRTAGSGDKPSPTMRHGVASGSDAVTSSPAGTAGKSSTATATVKAFAVGNTVAKTNLATGQRTESKSTSPAITHASRLSTSFGQEVINVDTDSEGEDTKPTVPVCGPCSVQHCSRCAMTTSAGTTAPSSGVQTVNGVTWTEHELHFTLNGGRPSERQIKFKCTRTSGDGAVPGPPAGIGSGYPGDVHVHGYMGGIQRWVATADGWREAEIGFHHPTYGKGRQLSHRTPFAEKHPSWVLDESLQRYKARDKKRLHYSSSGSV